MDKNRRHKLIENILGMSLSAKQMDSIKVGWRAFYNDPEQYRDSIVVDMVKLSLQKNVCDTGEEKSWVVSDFEKMSVF